MKKQILDIRTGKVKKRDFTAAEVAQWRKDQQADKKRRQQAEDLIKATDSAIGKLLALGLTAEEVQALTGRIRSANAGPKPPRRRPRREEPASTEAPAAPTEPLPPDEGSNPTETAPPEPTPGNPTEVEE